MFCCSEAHVILINMSDFKSLIVDTTDRIFRELAQPQEIILGLQEDWEISLWNTLEEAGLTLAWVPEKYGGSGVEIEEGFKILEIAGRYAVSVPLAETLLAGWLLAKAELSVPMAPITVSVPGRGQMLRIADGKLYGNAQGIPCLDLADYFLCIAEEGEDTRVVLVALEGAESASDSGMRGDGTGKVKFNGTDVVRCAPVPKISFADDLLLMGAAVRSQLMAGALQTVLEFSVTYAQERHAFGRPIGKFQIVQQNLARLAAETAAAAAAAGSAADTIQNAKSFDESVILEVAAAKIRTGEAATEGSAIAHQVHGAMGFTAEHVLQRFSKRLFAWRDDFGTETEWAVRLGRLVAASGADKLWPMIASR